MTFSGAGFDRPGVEAYNHIIEAYKVGGRRRCSTVAARVLILQCTRWLHTI